MSTQSIYISLISLILINTLKAQTGAGCPTTTCPNQFQIRTDAILGPGGEYRGGCVCKCPDYICTPPLIPNFDPYTLFGDCSCVPPPTPQPVAPPRPNLAAPVPPRPVRPVAPLPVSQQPPPPPRTGAGCPSRQCGHRNQIQTDAIFGTNGAYLGGCVCECPANICAPPSVPKFDPSTLEGDCSCYRPLTQPPMPVIATPLAVGNMAPLDVLCDTLGACSCPPGTRQPCRITCDGAEGCKDAVIDCNNDGFPCEINCIGDISCGSTTTINGPVGSSLTVNCIADKACEGTVVINGDKGTDLTVKCEGMEACKGNVQMNFGNGLGAVQCNGEPQSCQGARFNLPRGASTRPGVGFSCSGLFCPATAPGTFSNVAGPHTVTCDGLGDCACPVGLKDECTINCVGASDACKEGLIECNNDGFDCTVNCMELESCAGGANIMGPSGGKLTVQCIGEKACESSTINGEVGTDLTVVCHGSEACKGNTQINFGNGRGTVWCNGNPDSCVGALFNLPMNAEVTPGISFACKGDFCPPDAPAPFSNAPLPGSVPAPIWNAPVLPGQSTPATPATPVGNAPGPSPAAPAPGLLAPVPATPIAAPAPAFTVGSIVEGRYVGGRVTQWCCHTRVAMLTSWNGRCWNKYNANDCNSAQNNRCVWDESICFQSPPTCRFTAEACNVDSDCCSGVCRTSPVVQGNCR